MVDLTGQVFGRWRVMSISHRHPKSGNLYWDCVCACGERRKLIGSELSGGRTASCGCLAKEVSSLVHTTHGMKKSITYSSWKSMKSRCVNKKDPSYYRYGGRGITLCTRWVYFENFLEDMGLRPDKTYSIDRIDNNAGYNKDNCRWIKTVHQARNRRTNKIVEWRGQKMLMCELINMYGVKKTCVYSRLHRGWTLEEAILTPVGV